MPAFRARSSAWTPPCSTRRLRSRARRRSAPAGWSPAPRRERLAPDDAGHALLEPADHREARARGLGRRHDGAVADAEVEDAPLLLFRHAALVEPGVDGRPLPAPRVDEGAEPRRQG